MKQRHFIDNETTLFHFFFFFLEKIKTVSFRHTWNDAVLWDYIFIASIFHDLNG